MLEDCTMEKKPTARVGQAQGKGTTPESKKDVVGFKALPKTRRRESVGASSSAASKYDSPCKPSQLQKNKSFDKRPRCRGQYNCGGKEDAKVAPAELAEYGSVFVPGSKKQSLNHLLNFHYAPRGSTNFQPGSNAVRSQRWLPSTHKHKYNKEHFLQANCQFVVKSGGDYSTYLSNPDTLVDWDFVEQIRVQSDETLNCPICLSPPIAAKMTRCGHVFCWPCILHYLALSDKTWRSCPICYEAVHRNGLKSVVALQHSQVSVGNEVTMLLMCRERGSLVATPIGQSEYRATNQLLSVSETTVDTIYSKLLLATPTEVLNILASERSQLETQLLEEQGCPELCFTEQALDLLSQRLSTLNAVEETDVVDVRKAICDDQVFHELPEAQFALVYNCAFEDNEAGSKLEVPSGGMKEKLDDLQGQPDDSEKLDVFEDMHAPSGDEAMIRNRYESISSSEGGSTMITAEDLEIHQPHAVAPKQFYFYQASDGQHLYLHALNVRMLEMQYGSLSACPPTIRGLVVEKEAGSMTEELRKRLRYLQHLSVTCQFEVAEIDLRPPYVAKDILCNFQEQLEIRRRRRQSRAKQERRREKKINEVEDKRWGRNTSRNNVHIESTRHFPQWGAEVQSSTQHAASVSPAVSSLASSPRELVSPITAAVEALEINPQPEQLGGPSFAQMLREGKNVRPDWPSVTHKPVVSSRAARPRGGSDSEPEPEGYVPAPSFNQSFSAAIALALEKAEAQQSQVDVSQGSNKKKKKRAKQTLLFATSMAYTGK